MNSKLDEDFFKRHGIVLNGVNDLKGENRIGKNYPDYEARVNILNLDELTKQALGK